MASKIVLDRIVERNFHLRCSCGATLVTSEKTATCSNCGGEIEVRRVKKQRQRWNAVPRPGFAYRALQAGEVVKLFGYVALAILLLYSLYDVACG
jgi:predicted RNA-binding Zn-ribbon protein involved in translation (DUF1610 family)